MHIEAKTISDLWFRSLVYMLNHGYRQEIQQGSFEGNYRLQLSSFSAEIEMPWDDIVPIMPEGSGLMPPTTMEYIEDYFANYLMDPSTVSENETYRYGHRIHHQGNLKSDLENRKYTGSQFDFVIDLLKRTPFTNQAIIEIGTPNDYNECWGKDGKYDPPCCRLIDFKVVPPKELTISLYFRSWDLYAGLPTNLGGFEILKQFVADTTGLKNGRMFCYSSGLHIYDFQLDQILARFNRSV